MLIELEVNIKLPIIVFFILHEGMFEKFVDVILDKQGVSKNAHGLNNRAVDLIIMFNDTNETVRDDSDMNLDTDGIFAFAPEGLNLEMLLNPFEEQFDLPPVFIKECKLFIDSVITEILDLEMTLLLGVVAPKPRLYERLILKYMDIQKTQQYKTAYNLVDNHILL